MSTPSGAFTSGLQDIFSSLFGEGSIAQQFLVWGVAQQVCQALMGPYLQALSNDVNADHPEVPLDPGTLAGLVRLEVISKSKAAAMAAQSGTSADDFDLLVAGREVPLSPADAALAVLRGIMSTKDGEAAAARSGVSADVFSVLVDNTGEPPSVIDLLSLYRRGVIDKARLEKGIRQSRVRDEWIDTIEDLGVQPPTVAEVMNAWLQGQIEEPEANKRYLEAGGDPTWFQTSYNANGSAPTPLEAADMANRGVIPWTGTGPGVVSFEQAFLEGPWRNKWLTPYKVLAEYLPPPRTITAMFNEGSLTQDQAITYLEDQGLTPELAAAYVSSGSQQKTSTQKDLAVSQISSLYTDKAISPDQARGMLEDLNYTEAEANFILLLADVARVQRYLETGISTIHTEYTNHTIVKTDASNRLDQLGVPSAQRDDLLATWDIERGARVKRLTEAQVLKAHKEQVIGDDDALNRLLAMGYPEVDAKILITIDG